MAIDRRTVDSVLRLIRAVTDEDFLDSVGFRADLRPRSEGMPVLAVLGMGALVGAALGLMFAPMAGDKLRNELRDRANTARAKLAHRRNGEASVES